MEEVRASEVRSTLEDLMYVSILEKFITLGVEMLPRMDGAWPARNGQGTPLACACQRGLACCIVLLVVKKFY
jgi:hypothetical protein